MIDGIDLPWWSFCNIEKSKHYVVHLKLTQCYRSTDLPQLKKKKMNKIWGLRYSMMANSWQYWFVKVT